MPANPKQFTIGKGILMSSIPVSSDTITILTREQVCQRLTISKLTLHRYSKAGGNFPRKIQLGPRRVGYLKSDVERYLAAGHEAAEIPGKPLKPLNGQIG
jgi:predicted DNA-binding transcriptional regulator AlpA